MSIGGLNFEYVLIIGEKSLQTKQTGTVSIPSKPRMQMILSNFECSSIIVSQAKFQFTANRQEWWSCLLENIQLIVLSVEE